MQLSKRFHAAFVAVSLSFLCAAFGQGITSSALTGVIADRAGRPIPGAQVTVTHEPSGTVNSATTRFNGHYDLTGLRIGGPYTITVAPVGSPVQTRNDVYLELGQTSVANFLLGDGGVVQMEAYKVQGERDTTFGAAKISTGTNFNATEIENVATVRRNVQDIAQLDTRINLLNLSQFGELSAQGQNYRFNSFLVDNVQTNDPYGLNANGFAAMRSPVPLEALQALSVELNGSTRSTDTFHFAVDGISRLRERPPSFVGTAFRSEVLSGSSAWVWTGESSSTLAAALLVVVLDFGSVPMGACGSRNCCW